MQCRDCDKKLKGGFKRADGKFLCARCVINLSEWQVTNDYLQEIVGKIEDPLRVKGKRITRDFLKEIKTMCKSAIRLDKYDIN